MKTDNYEVGIYCRLSKDDGNSNDESASIQNQKNMLINYTMERGWNLAKVYADDGYTGTNYDRPDFKQMIEDIEDGKINLVLTKDLSRLGRNYVETGQYTENFFPNHGVRYIAVNDNIDTLQEDNDIAPFKNILNELYAKDISRKTRSAKKTLAQQGKFANSRAPYGYIKSFDNKHQLVIDENAVEIVKRIYTMFLNGSSGRYIADVFNREGILSPNAYYYESAKKLNPYKNQCNKWGSATILSIIRNPVYKGTMAQGKRKVTSFKNKKVLANPADTWIVVEDTHEAIIDKSMWEEAQKLIKKNHVGVRRSSSGDVSLFSGIVKCADCGSKMTYNRKIYKSYVKEYYRCGSYTNKGTDACAAHTIRQEYIYEAVINDLRRFAKMACSDEKQLINRLAQANNQHNDEVISKSEKLLAQKEYRLKEIDSLIQSLFEEKISGNVPENIFNRMAKKYDDEQLELSEEIDRLKNELSEMKRTEKDVSGWIRKIKKCLSIETLTREIVVELIDSIEISEAYELDGAEQQDIKITYRFENLDSKGKEKRAS